MTDAKGVVTDITYTPPGWVNTVSVTPPGGAARTTAYTYDATGNRTAKTVAGSTYTNTVASSSNRLTQTQDATGISTISHDATGNITGDGSVTYAYSDRGRMASASTAAGTVSYSYNALEMRVKKSGPTSLVVSS